MGLILKTITHSFRIAILVLLQQTKKTSKKLTDLILHLRSEAVQFV
jgi:hypothetical protein